MGESRKVKVSPLVIDKSDADNNNVVTRNQETVKSVEHQNQKNKSSPPMTPNDQQDSKEITEPWLVGSQPRYRRQSSLV